jgi:hypothetical protein
MAWSKGVSGNPFGAQRGRPQNHGQLGSKKANRKIQDRNFYYDVSTGEKKHFGDKKPFRGPNSQNVGPAWEPKVAVEDEDGNIDPLDYLQSLVSNRNKPDKDRIVAALGLAPFRYPKAVGERLSARIVMPAPKSAAEAQEQKREIIRMERDQEITHIEAERQMARLDSYLGTIPVVIHEGQIAAIEAHDESEPDAPTTFMIESVIGMMPGCENVKTPSHVQVKMIASRKEEEPTDGASESHGQAEGYSCSHGFVEIESVHRSASGSRETAAKIDFVIELRR